VPEAVARGGVHPVDAKLDGPPYGADGLVVVLMTPRAAPAGSAYRPGPEADGRYLQIRLAEPNLLQSKLLPKVSGYRPQATGSRRCRRRPATSPETLPDG
jgi:hypothetical protein